MCLMKRGTILTKVIPGHGKSATSGPPAYISCTRSLQLWSPCAGDECRRNTDGIVTGIGTFRSNQNTTQTTGGTAGDEIDIQQRKKCIGGNREGEERLMIAA